VDVLQKQFKNLTLEEELALLEILHMAFDALNEIQKEDK